MLSRLKFISFFLVITSPIFSASIEQYLIEDAYLMAQYEQQDTTNKLDSILNIIQPDSITNIITSADSIDHYKQDTTIKNQSDTILTIVQDSITKPPFSDSLNQVPLDSLKKNLKSKEENSTSVLNDTIKFIADSIPIITDSTAVHYFTESFDNFNLGKIYPIDTLLDGIQNYDPSYKAGKYFASLGNVGLPARNLRFKPNISEGFNYVYSPMDLYTYQNKDVKYYRVFQPFTEIFYAMGPKKENNFKVLLTQNISRGLNVGIDFKFINAPGIYQKQRSDNKNLYVTARYSTKNGRYGFIANYIHDKLITQENGGLESDSAFEYSLEVNRALISVNLEDATNTYKKGSIFINQYFNIGKAPSITTDSLGNKTKHHGLPLGRLSHTLFVERKQFFYEDAKIDQAFYSGLDSILNTENTFDSTRILKIENQFQWSNIGYEIHSKEMPLYMYFGIKQQHIEVADTISKQTFNHLIPKAGISVFLFNSFRLKADGFYVLGDQNDGDYSLNTRISQQLGSDKNNFGQLNLRAEISKQRPSYFYNLYRGNYLRWENEFKAENYITLQAQYVFRGIEAGVSYQKIDNFIFMDKTAHPNQTELTQTILTATLDYKLKYKDFTMDAHLIYQKPKSDSLLRLPELLGSVSIYYTKSLFKDATTIQPGIEVFYNTAYFADAYMPATRSFYLQDEKKIGGAIYADIYLNFTIKNTMFFFKYQHFNAAVTGYNYFMVPHYPMQDYAIKFGLIWRFVD